ncbi:MAG: hypothetical protein L0Z55_00045 [Planctomycetes bacterium]|nr:hypothetical protein [Planctomycetota bacterium]
MIAHGEERQAAAESGTRDLRALLVAILASPELHARWLNTLSLMENCGARKIARFEHPTAVTQEVLKHAAEEFRHAFHLKRQIARVSTHPCPNYGAEALLAPRESRAYLDRLDLAVCRHLKREYGARDWELRRLAYLLVTWAIEERAARLYPLYQDALDQAGSAATVRSIISEEDGHLREMESMLAAAWGEAWRARVGPIRECEGRLYEEWRRAVQAQVRAAPAAVAAASAAAAARTQ